VQAGDSATMISTRFKVCNLVHHSIITRESLRSSSCSAVNFFQHKTNMPRIPGCCLSYFFFPLVSLQVSLTDMLALNNLTANSTLQPNFQVRPAWPIAASWT
jgi:hypothetical protein